MRRGESSHAFPRRRHAAAGAALAATAVFALSAARQIAARAESATDCETREISGWTVHVSQLLLATNAPATARALELLSAQLGEIVRNVPPAAVAELRKIPLWISPEYPGIKACAEYHPNAGWLRAHHRDPAMAKGVEFTNVRVFEAEPPQTR